MKKSLLILLLSALCFHSCQGDRLSILVSDRIINADYRGNGAEWDPYDEAEAWGAAVSEEDWQKLFTRLDFMRMGYVRCMINSPYRYFDPKTETYDKMRCFESLRRLLEYCQKNQIDVVYGEYNPPTWAMKASQKWIDMSVDYLNFLVQEQGFDCIKHFIIFNEPDGNWASTNGDYDLWHNVAQRFIQKMGEYPGLHEKVSLAGPDVVMNYRNQASAYDTEGWIARSAADMGDNIGLYDIHAYPGQQQVRSGRFAQSLQKARAQVPAGKQLILGEAGYKYTIQEDSVLKVEYDRRVQGHPFTKGSDCNMLCYDYFYGLDMPLMAMEVMNNGLSGMAVWMLDDAMHSNGDSGKPEDLKIWGFWNILGEEVFDNASEEEIRPWYYTWSLMCRYFPAGCQIIDCSYPQTDGLRVVAAKKESAYSVAIVNFSTQERSVQISLPTALHDGLCYLYSEQSALRNEQGIPLPLKSDLSTQNYKTTIPANSLFLLTNMR
ncbi:MAG: hypothetical protein RRY33_05725 [Alistipes sp.]